MQSSAIADLELLGCTRDDTAPEIKLAYRLQARRLQRELLEDRPGANERLAMVNAAYDRLTSFSTRALESSFETAVSQQVRLHPAITKCLDAALKRHRFKLCFQSSRDPGSGAYNDPRRVSVASRLRMPGFTRVSAITLRAHAIEFSVSAPVQVGLNVLALPELQVGPQNILLIGSGVATIEFTVPRPSRRVRINSAKLPFALGGIRACELICPEY